MNIFSHDGIVDLKKQFVRIEDTRRLSLPIGIEIVRIRADARDMIALVIGLIVESKDRPVPRNEYNTLACRVQFEIENSTYGSVLRRYDRVLRSMKWIRTKGCRRRRSVLKRSVR